MNKWLVIFLMSSMQAVFAMQFTTTAQIRNKLKEFHPLTLHPSHAKPRVEDNKIPNRIMIARVDHYFGKYKYFRIETNQQIDELVSKMPDHVDIPQVGEIWKIEWFYYYPPIVSHDDDEYEDAHA